MSQLSELAKPFPANLVKQKPGKFAADYVTHSTVNERLLSIVGPFSFEVVEVVRDADGTVSGCLARLTLEVDGRVVQVTEVGDVEHPSVHAGSNLKSASSDAFKRCCMRLGLGLSLWSGDTYFLDRQLEKQT